VILCMLSECQTNIKVMQKKFMNCVGIVGVLHSHFMQTLLPARGFANEDSLFNSRFLTQSVHVLCFTHNKRGSILSIKLGPCPVAESVISNVEHFNFAVSIVGYCRLLVVKTTAPHMYNIY
jgi:hypothetical protein